MTSVIETLIDGQDNLEIVRDQIGAILKVELTEQRAKAAAAGKDPNLWDVRIFTERSNPWEEFVDAPDFAPPLVNICFESSNYDRGASSIHRKTHTTAVFNLDCYGYGVSREQVAGHAPGDREGAFEAQRAMRLVRRVLMSAHYAFLGMRGVVHQRWLRGGQQYQPMIDDRPVQRVIADRLSLEVQFDEFSPQWQGEPLELISVQVYRDEATSELLFAAEIPVT